MSCFGFGKSQVKEPVLPFTSFVLKVDPTVPWESIMVKVLKKTKVVSNFRMHSADEMQISGTMDPKLLLKVLAKSGKAAQIVGWQFGQCSRNLQMPEYEQIQEYKRHHQYFIDLQAYYDANSYQRQGGGHVPRYSNAQYLQHPLGYPAYGLSAY